ncbi:MAG: DUF2752 domain-containing protein [Actinomycetota bacterium]
MIAMRAPVTAFTNAQLAGGATVVLTGLVATAGAEDGFVLCAFRRCTGGYCPGCGATRAANRLARGDVAASWSHHPWVVLAAVQLAIIAAIALVARDRLVAARRWALPLGIANVGALLAIWAIRLADGSIPAGVFG